MAKKKKQAKAADGSAPAEKTSAPGSVLEQAWRAYQAGDVVTARAGCAQLLGGSPTPRDVSFAEKLAPELFGRKDAPTDVAAVASELKLRTSPYPKSYWFAAVTAAVFAVLLLIARRG
jgi:hypothetical protein